MEEHKIDDIIKLSKEEKLVTVDSIINACSGVYLPASNLGSGTDKP